MEFVRIIFLPYVSLKQHMQCMFDVHVFHLNFKRQCCNNNSKEIYSEFIYPASLLKHTMHIIFFKDLSQM